MRQALPVLPTVKKRQDVRRDRAAQGGGGLALP
jgi:hypothetical protein